jgi:hypothetical protein
MDFGEAEMNGAGASLQEAALAALRTIGGMGVYEGPPVQSVYPYAVAEAGLEADWSHKSGDGREVRLTVIMRDRGERPVRLRALMAAAELALGELPADLGGWNVASFLFLRSRLVAEGKGAWAGVIDYRARMLAVALED